LNASCVPATVGLSVVALNGVADSRALATQDDAPVVAFTPHVYTDRLAWDVKFISRCRSAAPPLKTSGPSFESLAEVVLPGTQLVQKVEEVVQ